MNLEQRQQILEEINRLTRPPQIAPHEFTVRMYADHNDLTIAVASAELSRAHRNGILTRRNILHDGKRKWAYSLSPEPDNPACPRGEQNVTSPCTKGDPND